MAKKKTKSQPEQPPQQQVEQQGQQEQTASPRRRPVIALVGIALAAIFLVSFIYRTQNQGLQVERRSPQQAAQNAERGGEGQGGMPPEMEQAMMGDIGQLMEKLRETPDDTGLLLQLADRFMTMQAWENAETFLTRAMVAEPANTDVLYKLGIVNFEQQRVQDAAGYFEQIAALDPQHAHARLNLGILYNHYLEQPEKARPHLEAVLEIEGVPQEMQDAARQELEHEHESPATAQETDKEQDS